MPTMTEIFTNSMRDKTTWSLTLNGHVANVREQDRGFENLLQHGNRLGNSWDLNDQKSPQQRIEVHLKQCIL